MRLLRLALTMLGRDWRAGELRLLIAALVIAVGAVTTVGFFADRVGQALSREANQLLGADLVIVSDRPVAAGFSAEAMARGLEVSESVRFPSMVTAGDRNVLAEVKSADGAYPLRGEMRTAPALGGAEARVRGAPARGAVWVDEKLLARLGVAPGDTVEVGAARLRIEAVVTREPDAAIGFVNLGPRVLLNHEDLPATELIQVGSRVGYRVLVAGEAKAVEAYREWAAPRLERGQKIEGIRDARPEVKAALERAEKFLGLAALVSVVLAAAAVALAARRFSERHLDACAMLRCLGARQRDITAIFGIHLAALGIAASLVGCLVGLGAQQVLAFWLAELVGTQLPPPGWLPAVQGFLTGTVVLLGFALPPVLSLSQVPTLRVLRREMGPRALGWAGRIAGFLAVAFLVFWQAREPELAAWVLGGFAGALAVAALVGWGLVAVLARLRPIVGGGLRHGLAGVTRRRAASVVQMTALGLGLMALLVLTLTRNDLLANWRASLPADAPNRFLVNIQRDQLPALKSFFVEKGLGSKELFPMVRGRLVEVNGRPVNPEDFAEPRARRLAEREFNLSWATGLQPDNRIVAGRWWRDADRGQALLSVEDGIAKTLGIGMGDSLTYDVAGTRFTAKVASLRKVEWDTFRVNFFVIASPGLIDNYPASFITSFYLPDDRQAVMHELVKAFPNVLVIDVASILGQVKRTIDQVSRAVEFVFVFTLMAGVMVLYAAIGSTQDERMVEAAVMRTLGASRRQLLWAQASEFLILGSMAGIFAAAGATALGYFVATRVLTLPWTPDPWVWVIGLAAGAIGVTAFGLLGTRRTLARPPLQTLRAVA